MSPDEEYKNCFEQGKKAYRKASKIAEIKNIQPFDLFEDHCPYDEAGERKWNFVKGWCHAKREVCSRPQFRHPYISGRM